MKIIYVLIRKKLW